MHAKKFPLEINIHKNNNYFYRMLMTMSRVEIRLGCPLFGEALIFFLLVIRVYSADTEKEFLTIEPSGPVAVFDVHKPYHDDYAKPIVITCRSLGNYNITWDLPPFPFAELANPEHFQAFSKQGKHENDLLNRVQISTIRNANDDGFTSTLTILNLTNWDEGYYTCRSTNPDERIISSRLYIFPYDTGGSQLSDYEPFVDSYKLYYHVDSLRSFYVVPKPTQSTASTIIIPCWIFMDDTDLELYLKKQEQLWEQEKEYYDNPRIKVFLQRKNETSRNWEQVDNTLLKMSNWTYTARSRHAWHEMLRYSDSYTYHGFQLSFNEEDAGSFAVYRCIADIDSDVIAGIPFSILVEGFMNETSSAGEHFDSEQKLVIRPSVKYLVFQPASIFKLTCETNIERAGYRITWDLPVSRFPPTWERRGSLQSRTWDYKTTWAASIINPNVTVSTLTVFNATYSDTGVYTCKCSDDNDKERFSEQYVFIPDSNVFLTFTIPPYDKTGKIVGLSPEPYNIMKNQMILNAVHLFPVAVWIIPTSPLVDIILYRRLSEGDTLQVIYPPTGINNGFGKWSHAQFEGFSMANSSWDDAGNYEVVGSSYNKTKENYRINFVIYVEGIEIISSDAQAIRGKSMSLHCRCMLPFGFSEEMRTRSGELGIMPMEWFWIPQVFINKNYFGHFLFENYTNLLAVDKSMSNSSLIPIIALFPPYILREGKFSLRSTLTFKSLTQKANGRFRCGILLRRENLRSGFEKGWFIDHALAVLEPKSLVVIKTVPEGNNTLEAAAGEDITLSCQVNNDAVPAAIDILWIDNKRGSLVSDGVEVNGSWTSLTFRVSSNFSSDGEEFTCQFNNSEETARKTFKVSLKSDVGTGVAIGIAVVIVVILLGFLLRNVYLIKKRDELIRDFRENLLQSGDPERINPEIPLEEQIDLLPYDSKWEFPREKLYLGKQLGSGQFGVVVQAQQTGTVLDQDDDTVRQVAVKMNRPTSDPRLDRIALASLASELKILIHLGPHLNVVNLLGACTKGIVDDGELLVIEEFCCGGNIRDFLIANKSAFFNELNHEIIAGEPSQASELSLMKPSWHQKKEPSCSVDSNQCVAEFGPKNKNVIAIKSNMVRNSGEGISRMRTRDLICWSFQIACGMNHLANKRVIHGDLAARNVLLTEGNVVKISDFGLSRQTKYKDGTYKKKKGNVPLPVKWMAIESLTERTFTTQSDVWSFGVFLWELFSLGLTPYPEIRNKDIIKFIRNNGRLEKPVFMPSPLANITAKCWENDPKERPDFSQLVKELGNMLDNDVENHFLKMMDFTSTSLQNSNEFQPSQSFDN